MHPSGDLHNNKVFDELFREHFKSLCAFCQFKFAVDIEIAKDAVHSAFMNLLGSDFNFSSELAAKAYLYKSVTNICLDLKRHEKIIQNHVEFYRMQVIDNESNTEIIAAELKELQNEIDKAVEALPEQMRTVFRLSRYEGLKYAAIADQLGISIKTVETQMTRALVKLRKSLAPYLSVCFLLMSIEIL